MKQISIHAPRTGSDRERRRENRQPDISIHAPRTGSDNASRLHRRQGAHFNPRSPHGERRVGIPTCNTDKKISIHAPRTGSDVPRHRRCDERIISIHAPRTGSDDYVRRETIELVISIHAPRTGSDVRPHVHRQGVGYFNPRSPHGERQLAGCITAVAVRFQSTLPARGATVTVEPQNGQGYDFNPRSPHGERPGRPVDSRRPARFQSTLPARGATALCCDLRHNERISIHAPRTGSD